MFPGARRHPSSLLFYRALCDLLVEVNFIIQSYDRSVTPVLTFDASDNRIGDNHDESCVGYSVFFQFFIMASGSWYFIMSVETMRALRNPFTPHNTYPLRNNLFVWGVSAFQVILMLGVDVYGISALGFCWIKSLLPPSHLAVLHSCPCRYDAAGPNIWNWILFFIPMVTTGSHLIAPNELLLL